ncbi:MAG: type II toxin-antitoxin system VapC family toxin [Endozoicomonas sp.]
MVLIDTHVAIFLYNRQMKKFTPKVRILMDINDIVLPEMARLELQYLYEIGRISATPVEIINFLYSEVDLILSKTPKSRLVDEAVKLTWTRDPFDRLICADSKVNNAPLISKDEKMLEHLDLAVW